MLGVLARGILGLFTQTFDFRTGELWFRFGVIVDIIGGKLKEDKAGKNSNPDVNVTLRAFDPPLRYPLNESDPVWKSNSELGCVDGVGRPKFDFHAGRT